MRKYNDLIVSMIKAHRKYPGCEDILDKIVEDVYNHAEVVLNTVSNESVITSYLNKIVATSMVTVPKRLGFSPKKESAVIVEKIIEEPISEQNFNTQEILNNADTELEELNLSDEIELAEHQKEEERLDDFGLVEDSDAEAVINDEDTDDELNTDTLTNDISDTEEVLLTEEDLQTEDMELTIEEPSETEPVEPDVDKSLVDKMINGISEDVLDDENENNLLESSEEVGNEIISDVDNADVPELELELGESQYQPLTDEIDLGQDSLETESLVDDYETVATTEETTEDTVDELIEADDMTEDVIKEQNVAKEISEGDADSVETQDSDNGITTPAAIYNKFKFSPEKTSDTNKGEILQIIKDLDDKHPDKNYYEICKLKYKERLSISEIASKLNIGEDTVIDALNDIIYEIKD